MLQRPMTQPMSSGPPAANNTHPSDLSFRVAHDGDVATILPCMRDYYAADGYQFDEQLAGSALADMIRDPSLGRVWIVSHGSTPVGYVILTLGYSLEFHGRDAFIDELYVVPEYWGRGIGSNVMRIVEDACRELGVRAVHLEVERDNPAARALYLRFGFKEQDRLLMTRWIARHQRPPEGGHMRRAMTHLALLVLLSVFAGCRRGVPEPRDPRAETTLRVENRNFSDMNIFVLRSGQRQRLGTVSGLSTRTLVIPANLVSGAAPLRFLADPIGGNRTPVSQEITVQPGDQVELAIPPT